MKIYFLCGLPASGKSTWALEQCSADPNVVRVNKDDIRAELTAGGWKWSKKNEKDVIIIRDNRIQGALLHGHDVIVDDTNFAHVHRQRIKELAQQFSAEFVEKFFHVDIEEAIRRDAARSNSVGEKVIRDMAQQYLPPPVMPYIVMPGLPEVVICDLDGTAALIGARSPYDGANCHLDAPNEAVRRVLWAMATQTRIIYLSGRNDDARNVTKKWLNDHDFPSGNIFMRATGDRRKDTVIKSELFDREIRGKYNVLLVLDDRTSVVAYWRSLGLTCWQVAAGDF